MELDGEQKMGDSRIYGYTSKMIAKAMDVSARRHNLIAGNIANMDTIGYKPRDLDFNDTLNRAMAGKQPDYIAKTHPKHLPAPGDDAFIMPGENSEDVDIYHLDSVNIDTEMMHLMENNIKYRTAVELKLRKSTITNYAIDEGGK
ncbi:MAG: flagellar basal body rod protein FlgB [Desulfotignum sp.]